VDAYSAVSAPAQGAAVLLWQRDMANRGDALTLLRSLPASCSPLEFSDPQHGDVLDNLTASEDAAPSGAHAG
jgi:hypothetical protein